MPEVSRYSAPDTDLIAAAQPALEALAAHRVVVVDGPDAGARIRLERRPLILGTSDSCDLVLYDPTVSRTHARLSHSRGGVEVRDLESKNGVFVSGSRIIHARVAPGSELRLGRTVVRIVPELDETELEPSGVTELGGLRGKSFAMRRLFALMERVIDADCPVLVHGEAGAGKLRVARAIHLAGARAKQSVVVVDGRDVGAGGVAQHLRRLEGTVIVTGIENLRDAARRGLLKELETGRLGARLVATTRHDLDEIFSKTHTDRALRLRLGGVRLRVPPLRERASDIPILTSELLEEIGHPGLSLGPDDLGRMQAYAWPDNVRELRATLQRMAVERAAPSVSGDPRTPPPRRATESMVGADLPYKEARAQMIEAFEREYARSLLERHEGNVSRAARNAGIDRVYLHRLMRKYGL